MIYIKVHMSQFDYFVFIQWLNYFKNKYLKYLFISND